MATIELRNSRISMVAFIIFRFRIIIHLVCTHFHERFHFPILCIVIAISLSALSNIFFPSYFISFFPTKKCIPNWMQHNENYASKIVIAAGQRLKRNEFERNENVERFYYCDAIPFRYRKRKNQTKNSGIAKNINIFGSFGINTTRST